MKPIRFLLLALSICLATEAFALGDLPVFFKVRGDSMAPAFPVGAMVAQSSIGERIARHDAVVIRDPTSSDRLLLTRVVGLSGDRIEVVENSLWVNGARLTTPAVYVAMPLPALQNVFHYPAANTAFIVPSDSYFVLNDNPDSIGDSRRFGAVRTQDILARAALWSEVLRLNDGPRPYLERAVKQIQARLPMDLTGVKLVAVRVSGDRKIDYELAADPQLDIPAFGQFQEAAVRLMRSAYCENNAVLQWQVGAQIVLMDRAGARISQLDVNPSDCPTSALAE